MKFQPEIVQHGKERGNRITDMGQQGNTFSRH